MKYILLILILLFALSCGEENTTTQSQPIQEESCSNVECPENSHCEIQDNTTVCLCNDNYIKQDDICKKIPQTAPVKFRIATVNLTSGNRQAYEEEGIRILKALKSDIIIIQEFNYQNNTESDIKHFVKDTFGNEYVYFRGTPNGNGDIPNGIISKYPIINSGEITDPAVTDRKLDYAEIKVNDNIKLMVFSLHLKAKEPSSQIEAAKLVSQKIFEHQKNHTGYYYIAGGDFNGEAALSDEGFGEYNNKKILQTNYPYPKSEYGNNTNTNRTRTAKLDFILVDYNLYKYQTSTDYCTAKSDCKKYENGLVFDSRDYSETDLNKYFNGVKPNDCDAKNMQHMAVIKDFTINDETSSQKKIISEEEFNSIFKNPVAEGKSTACPGYNFYTYEAFIKAAKDFPAFGNEGDEKTRKREIAAFLANISHETTGGWDNAPGGENGRYLWGLCWIEQIGCEDGSCTQYCQEDLYPCASGKTYHGRGPIQLTWNYNYGFAGEELNIDLLNYPEKVSTDAFISFKTALWFWMTPQPPKPSAHDVMTGKWKPSQEDIDKNRLPGFGMTVNIINGKSECGKPNNSALNDRVGHFKYFCELLNTDTGDNIYCHDMQHY